jgi:hypothetical protein
LGLDALCGPIVIGAANLTRDFRVFPAFKSMTQGSPPVELLGEHLRLRSAPGCASASAGL